MEEFNEDLRKTIIDLHVRKVSERFLQISPVHLILTKVTLFYNKNIMGICAKCKEAKGTLFPNAPNAVRSSGLGMNQFLSKAVLKSKLDYHTWAGQSAQTFCCAKVHGTAQESHLHGTRLSCTPALKRQRTLFLDQEDIGAVKEAIYVHSK